MSGPKTAPGATKSYLPKTGFAALGGGPDYSTTLSFDNFSVGPPVSGGPGGSLCHAAPLAAGMAVVAVPCGLDVPGLAFDIDVAAQRIMPRSDHSLCIARSNSSRLVLQACKSTASASQAFIYNRAAAVIRPASAAPPPSNPSPWAKFTPGEGVPYGAGFKIGDTLTGVQDWPGTQLLLQHNSDCHA
eukprot:SAG22_NODE_212_length_15072_cov_3.109197_4_plen_187_part_00